MDSRINRDQERAEWRLPPGVKVVLVQPRQPRTFARPAARTVRSEALAFRRAALAELRAFGTEFGREVLRLFGIW